MEPNLANLAVDQNASWILIEFVGPGSAVIKGVGHRNVHPYQVGVAAIELEVTAKNAIIEMRNKIMQAAATPPIATIK
jgi:hypothetical protein